MARIDLSASDIDLIGRVVATEVPRSIARRDPQAYRDMVGAVVDTITNRLASGRYGNTVADVLNQRRAFSKITGPKRLDPYGSVQAAPKAAKAVQKIVNEHIGRRANSQQQPQIGGALDYANPHFSDRKNLLGWVNPMIAAGAKRLGIGNAVHYHGLAPGNFPAPPTTLGAPSGFMPKIDPDMTYQTGIPMPSSRPSLALAATPVGKVERRPLDRPASLPPDRKMSAGKLAGSAPVDRIRPMPTAISLPPDRPMPTGPLAPQPAIDPKILDAYQQYAASRMAAPALPVAPTQPPAPPLGPPQVVQPRPVYQAPQPLTDEQFNARAPMPPPSRPMDVYSGLADTARDAMGNTVFSDPRGIGITNRFGATTFSKDGLTTAAGGGPFGGLGLDTAFEPDPTLGGRSPAGNMARQGVGGIGGAAVGGLLGPVGSLLGGLIGRELAKPGGGKIGDFVNGVRTVNGMQFARPDYSLRSFPNAPSGGPRDPRFSNRSDREMREISPRAARDISKGKGGLY